MIQTDHNRSHHGEYTLASGAAAVRGLFVLHNIYGPAGRRILLQAGLKAGMHVADLGAGSGFYTMAAAPLVGQTGRVFAVEVQKDLLARLKSDSAREGLANVEVVWGDVEKIGGTRLRDHSIDRAIVSNILFQIETKEDFAKEVKRILKPEGKAMVIDWSSTASFGGPAASSLVKKEAAIELFNKAGMVLEKEFSAGDNHYGLIFKKS